MILPRRSPTKSYDDRRVKSNRPKVVDCIKTSLARVKASIPQKPSPKRVTRIPSMLFGDLPTSASAHTERYTDAYKKGFGSSPRKALTLFDEAFGDDFDFDEPFDHGRLPSLGPISSLQSRALPAPPGGLRLDRPSYYPQPVLREKLKPSCSSHRINSFDVVSSGSRPVDLLLLEPRAIEDMSQGLPFFPDDDDLAPFNAFNNLGYETPSANHFRLDNNYHG
jgi:hypothetical protein